MADAVFDTTVFVDAYLLHPGAMQLLLDARRGRMDAAYSPVSVYELWLQPLTRRGETFHLATMSVLDEIPFGAAAARLVADWLRGSSRAARLRLASDAMIAASAATVGATVYTRNVRDLSRFYPNVQPY